MLFSSPPSEVYAVQSLEVANAKAGYLQLHFGFPAGGMALLDFSSLLPSDSTYNSLSLIGSMGAAYLDDHHNAHLLYRNAKPLALISERGHMGLLQELQTFVDAVQASSNGPSVANSLVSVHRVMEAVAQSLQLGTALHKCGETYEPA